jgi:hypothetical protein
MAAVFLSTGVFTAVAPCCCSFAEEAAVRIHRRRRYDKRLVVDIDDGINVK